MEDRIKEMKKKYAKIQLSVQRSERAARARSHVRSKLAEQKASKNEDEKKKSIKNDSTKNCVSFEDCLSSSQKNESSNIQNKKYTSCSKVNSVNTGEMYCVNKDGTDECSHQGSTHKLKNKEVFKDGTDECSQQGSTHKLENKEIIKDGTDECSQQGRTHKLENKEKIKDGTDECSQQGRTHKLENKEIIKDSIVEEGNIRDRKQSIKENSQILTTSELRRRVTEKQKGSRDMEYLASSLKESMEFDSGSKSHTFVDDMPYPAEYYVRRTRSMKWRQWSEQVSDSLVELKEINKQDNKGLQNSKTTNTKKANLESPVIDSIDKPVADSIARPVCDSIKRPIVNSIEGLVVDTVEGQVGGSIKRPIVNSIVDFNKGPVVDCVEKAEVNSSVEEPVVNSIERPVYSIESTCDSLPSFCRNKDAAAESKSGLVTTTEDGIINFRSSPLESIQSCLTDSDESVLQQTGKRSGSRTRRGAKKSLSFNTSKPKTQTKMSSKSNLYQTKISEMLCQSAGVSEGSVQRGIRRSKLSRRKVKSCDNSPLNSLIDHSFNLNDCKYSTRSLVKNFLTDVQCNEPLLTGNIKKEVNSSHSITDVSGLPAVDHSQDRVFFPAYPHHRVQKSNTDFYLPDPEFVHLKVAKVRNTPVMMTRQSIKNTLGLIKPNICKVLDLQSDSPRESTEEKSEVEFKPNCAKEKVFLHETSITKVDDKAMSAKKLVTDTEIVQDSYFCKSPDLLCSEGSSVMASDVPSCKTNIDYLTEQSDLNSEPIISSDLDTSVNIKNDNKKECLIDKLGKQNNILDLSPENGASIAKENINLREIPTKEDANNFITENSLERQRLVVKVVNTSEQINNLETEREKTPVDPLMIDSIGSNVTQESPFSGVATGTPPQSAVIPNADAGEADLLEEPVARFNGCLSNALYGRIVCFDCLHHKTIGLFIAVCSLKSLVIWSRKLQTEFWEIQVTFDLSQEESFESICMVYKSGSIWMTASGKYTSSSLRLLSLKLEGIQTLQEHQLTTLSLFSSSQVSSLCSVAETDFAGVSYQANTSTLFHIPISNSSTEVKQFGKYLGMITSIQEITGTEHWIVGMSKGDVIIGNIKLGQIVKCIPWMSPLSVSPNCLLASTEKGLLFLVLGYHDDRVCSRLDVVNPETGRISTLVEYINENKQPSRSAVAWANNQHIATCLPGGSLSIWDVYSGQVVADIDHIQQTVADGKHMQDMSPGVRLNGSKDGDKTLLFIGMDECVHICELCLNS